MAQSFVDSAKEYGVDENIINFLYCLQRPAMRNGEQADSYHSSTEEQANYPQTHKSISCHQNTSNKQSSCSHKRRSSKTIKKTSHHPDKETRSNHVQKVEQPKLPSFHSIQAPCKH